MVDEKSVKGAVFEIVVTLDIDSLGAMLMVVVEGSGIKVTVCVSVTTVTGEASKETLKLGSGVDRKDTCSGITGITGISGDPVGIGS